KIGVYAVRKGVITEAQAEAVAAAQRTQDRRWGELAIEMGFLTAAQIGALVVLGFVTKEVIERELSAFRDDQAQYSVTELALPPSAPHAQELSVLVSLTQKMSMRLCGAECKWGVGMP